MKIWAYLAIAALVIGAATAAYAAVYKAGYSSAVAKQQELAIIAQNDAIEAARIEWALSAEAGQAEIIIEERIVEVVREVIKEIPVVVDRIVELTPECADLGGDFLRVYNDAIRAGGGGEDGPAADTVNHDGAVPGA